MRDFTRLEVWRRARSFTKDIYEVTGGFPRSEQFGLTGQLRSAAISIGANLAEGAGRGSDVDYARFVRYAAGSASELIHHLFIASDLGFLLETDHKHLQAEAASIRSMLTRLAAALGRPSS